MINLVRRSLQKILEGFNTLFYFRRYQHSMSGCQAGDQAGQVHSHQGPLKAVWLDASKTSYDIP